MNNKIMIFINLFSYVKKFFGILAAVCLLAPAAAMGAKGNTDRPAQPNVILLLVDDLGWQDVKCYDIDEPSPMETPNMDTLATRGVLFRQAYSAGPVCAPSRAAILSGIHPARAQHVGVGGGNPPNPHNRKGSRMINPWDRGSLAPNVVTLATALKKQGYVTGHSGKWHLSKGLTQQPTEVGFDWSRENHGIQEKMKPHRMTGFATREENDPYRLDDNGFPRHQNSEDALAFVRQHQAQPFFLFLGNFPNDSPACLANLAFSPCRESSSMGPSW